MSADTSSLFQMAHERGWQWGLGNLLRGELTRWFKSKRVRLHIVIALLIVDLMLFFTTTGPSEATQAAPSAGVSPPKVETEMIYRLFAGMLVAFAVMIIVRGAIAGERRSGTAAWLASRLLMPGKLADNSWARFVAPWRVS